VFWCQFRQARDSRDCRKRQNRAGSRVGQAKSSAHVSPIMEGLTVERAQLHCARRSQPTMTSSAQVKKPDTPRWRSTTFGRGSLPRRDRRDQQRTSTTATLSKGQVVKVDSRRGLLDMATKTEASYPRRELSSSHDRRPHDVVKTGEPLSRPCPAEGDKEGRLILSQKRPPPSTGARGARSRRSG